MFDATFAPQLDELTRLAYEAACGQARWLAFAGRFAELIGYDRVILSHEDVQRDLVTLVAPFGVQDVWLQRYRDHYRALSPYDDPAIAEAPAGSTVRMDLLVPDAELRATEFYRDYMAPQGLSPHGAIRMTVFNDAHVRSCVCMFRNEGSAGDPEFAVQVAEALMPSLESALTVHHRLTGLELTQRRLTETLDRLPHGVALLDDRGSVLVMNRRASEAIEAEDGLSLEQGTLRASVPPATAELEQALESALHGEGPDALGTGDVVHLERPSRRRAYELLVSPLGTDEADPAMGTACAVFICDPETDAPLSSAPALRRTYGLTRREAQVALGVMRGNNIQEIATCLELGRETVKTHLAGVYGKTGCRGQAELVRRLLLGVGALQAPESTATAPAPALATAIEA